MTLVDRLNKINSLKFSFGKASSHAKIFAYNVNACSMFSGAGFGLGLPPYLSAGNKLRAVFREVMNADGIFLFNLSGVDLKIAKKGFTNYDEAESNHQITEWELYTILSNRDYLK